MIAQTFIGFDELRLNSKLTPAAAKTQLQTFADAGVFTDPLPANPATITDATADGGRLLRIKRFVFGNCVSCHNGEGQVDLRPDVFVANTVGKATEAQSVKPPAGWLRVVPGEPAKSVVYVQMQRTMLPPMDDNTRLRAMPPLGVADVAADQAALKDVFDWITGLPK
jgi:mono/diheme cytochrome c family protein